MPATASDFTDASEPTTFDRTEPVCLMPAGASSAASIVGAMSIRYGVVVNGVTAGPAATITPSMRWSPLTQSASSIADFAWVRL